MKGQLILQSAIKQSSATDYLKSRFNVNLTTPIKFKKLTLKHLDIPFTWGHLMTPYIGIRNASPRLVISVEGVEHTAIVQRYFNFSFHDLLTFITNQLNSSTGLNFSFEFNQVNGLLVLTNDTNTYFDIVYQGELDRYLGFVPLNETYYTGSTIYNSTEPCEYFSANFIRLAIRGVSGSIHYMNNDLDSASFIIPYNAAHLSFGDKIQHPQNNNHPDVLEFDNVQTLQAFTVEIYDYDNRPLQLSANWLALLDYE